MSLQRFHQAQTSDWSGYSTALGEIRAGAKRSHWIWYIFPQVDGLGRSSTARQYALRDLGEACDYLQDATLRARYEEITAAVADQLAAGRRVETLMGGSTDAMKLASSMTLFCAAARQLAVTDPTLDALATLCDDILAKTAQQGYPGCARTLELIG